MSEDNDRLFLAVSSCLPSSFRGIHDLSRQQSVALWDTFVSREGRHGMLLPASAWPSVKGAIVQPPLPPRFTSARLWLVCFMRERASVVSGAELERSLDDLLAIDSEAVIAMSTDTLDTLQSWGGHHQWTTVRRPIP